jgi:2-amino-1-hydroxyethylphosphonate dioxygenase (glycine-forming)
VGHLCAPDDATRMPGLGVVDHEAIGARVVREARLPEDVAWLVAHHVAAKRYLVATRVEYAAKLSEASKATLVHQGGAMTDAEARAFEAEPRSKEALRLRAWDEQAKLVGWSGPPLEDYRALVERLRT